jgi:protein-tyrosine phosphatase
MRRTILFLCTGNYYRSRFAELYFNALTGSNGLTWRAVSRGLATERGLCNVGPISPQALEGLATRGIAVVRPLHWPMQVLHGDLEAADLVVALKESEHRPLIEARFPCWSERVEYWHIDDLEQVPAAEALPQLEQRVHALLDRLSRDPSAGLYYR